MNKNVHIRPLTFDDIDDIVALKINVLSPSLDSAKEKMLFEWKLKLNPCRNDDFPIGFVLESDNGIAGVVVLVPANIKIGAETVYSCFEEDLMVTPEYRFHGLKLLNKVWRENIFPVVLSTTPNKISFAIEKLLGAKDVTLTRFKYVKMINPYRLGIIKYSSKVMGMLLSVLNACFSVFNKYFSMDLNLLSGEKFTIEDVSRFDERFDRFYEEASQGYDVLVERSSRYLNWRYIDFPFGEKAIRAILDIHGKLRGYIVIQKERLTIGVKVAHIIDVFAGINDKSALAKLFYLAIEYSASEGFEYIQLIPCSNEIAKMAGSFGFMRKKLQLPACLYKTNNNIALKASDRMDRWFISAGDGDTSIYSALTGEPPC